MTLVHDDDYGLLPPHTQPEARFEISLPQILWFGLLIEVGLWIFVKDFRTTPLAWTLAGISVPIFLWLLLHKQVMNHVFTIHREDHGQLSDPRWSPFRYTGWGGDVKTARYLAGPNGTSDLVVMLHGYGSSLKNIETRALHLAEMGTTVVGLNLRGHGECDRVRDWTLLKVAEDIEGMLEAAHSEFRNEMPERIWFYGHSVGGFLALYFGANPKGWWHNRLAGIMLESPATSFPLVIESMLPPQFTKVMPWVRNILRREFERIHPDLPIRYANAQVPHFGMPEVPILLMQAARDNRLSLHHFNLLRNHLDDAATIRLLASQPHTSGVDSDERQRVVTEWLKPRLKAVAGDSE